MAKKKTALKIPKKTTKAKKKTITAKKAVVTVDGVEIGLFENVKVVDEKSLLKEKLDALDKALGYTPTPAETPKTRTVEIRCPGCDGSGEYCSKCNEPSYHCECSEDDQYDCHKTCGACSGSGFVNIEKEVK